MFDSVLTYSVSAQPADPEIDARYLLPPGATGADWAGKEGRVGVYLESGWHFAVYPIGRLLFIEDQGAFYHRDKNGAWIAGVGSIAIVAGTIAITAIIGASASTLIKVENQTTNAPPASPVVPNAYIVGSSPSGSWVGQTGKLAICLVNGSFEIIDPAEGDEVYDKSLKINVKLNGTTWVSAAGVWVGRAPSTKTSSGLTTAIGGGSVYTYSSATPPTTSHRSLLDQAGIAYPAKRSGSVLRIDYTADYQFLATVITGGSSSPTIGPCVALFRDLEANAIDWRRLPHVVDIARLLDLVVSGQVTDFFEITAGDTASHTYTLRFTSGIYNSALLGPSDAYLDCTSLTRRTLAIQEAA